MSLLNTIKKEKKLEEEKKQTQQLKDIEVKNKHYHIKMEDEEIRNQEYFNIFGKIKEEFDNEELLQYILNENSILEPDKYKFLSLYQFGYWARYLTSPKIFIHYDYENNKLNKYLRYNDNNKSMYIYLQFEYQESYTPFDLKIKFQNKEICSHIITWEDKKDLIPNDYSNNDSFSVNYHKYKILGKGFKSESFDIKLIPTYINNDTLVYGVQISYDEVNKKYFITNDISKYPILKPNTIIEQNISINKDNFSSIVKDIYKLLTFDIKKLEIFTEEKQVKSKEFNHQDNINKEWHKFIYEDYHSKIKNILKTVSTYEILNNISILRNKSNY